MMKRAQFGVVLNCALNLTVLIGNSQGGLTAAWTFQIASIAVKRRERVRETPWFAIVTSRICFVSHQARRAAQASPR